MAGINVIFFLHMLWVRIRGTSASTSKKSIHNICFRGDVHVQCRKNINTFFVFFCFVLIFFWGVKMYANVMILLPLTNHIMSAIFSMIDDLSYEPQREKTYLLTCAHKEGSNQTAHLHNMIRVFVVHMKKLCFLGYPKCAQ